MTIDTFSLGALDTNSFVVGGRGTDCWLFDCPGEPETLIQALEARGATLQAVYLTHAHVDHMAGLETLRRAYPGVLVYQHAAEASWLSDPQANLSAWMGGAVTAQPATGFLADGDVLTLGPWSVHVLHVPGHSPGSLAYWFKDEGELVGGDVLFRSGVGRWDFPGSDPKALRASLDRLCQLPDETRVRPGHGASTTIGREKTTNVYLRSDEPWL